MLVFPRYLVEIGNKQVTDTRKTGQHGPNWFRKERLSLRAVSARLAEQGYKTGKGKPFSAEQVKRLLAA